VGVLNNDVKAKEWLVNSASYSENGPNYPSSVNGQGRSKISLEDAIQKSLKRCSKWYDDCIVRDISTWSSFFKKISEEKVWNEEYKKYSKKLKKDQLVIEGQKQEEIMFTIKDKREQCEAIGFKPETEKFADCVLRLVELDVKQQTQNQIATAQNNGNDALAKQLKRQNNLQSSQALIDLGQQLMNPKRYNSNIYMPQTQRCTMQGFGTFATMRCR
jgi:hypothetical protein